MLTFVDRVLSLISPDIGIDLGTAETPVLECGKGVAHCEPSYVAFNRRYDKVVAVGAKAKQMDGRGGLDVEVVRPVREGMLADYHAGEVLMRTLLSRAGRTGLMGPRVMIGVPVGSGDVECRAVSEAARAAGARTVFIVPQPLAAAVGADLPVMEACGTLVVDVGGGTSQAAVISMGGIIVSDCLRLGGDRFDQEICEFLRQERHLLVGHTVAEDLKKSIGSAVISDKPQEATVYGRDVNTGLPTGVVVNSNEICQILSESLQAIASMVAKVLESTPPALANDVMDRGLALTGGSALLGGLDTYLTQKCGVYCRRVPQPALSVAVGAEKMFKNPRLMRTVFHNGSLSVTDLR